MPNSADAVAGRPAVAAPGLAGLVASWRQIVFGGNLAPGRPIDAVSRWLLITRACVFPMTLTSGLIGGILAATTAPARWRSEEHTSELPSLAYLVCRLLL